MGQHPWLRPEDIEHIKRLFDRDVEYRHIIDDRELAAWMDADDRFATYVEETQPAIAAKAKPYRQST